MIYAHTHTHTHHARLHEAVDYQSVSYRHLQKLSPGESREKTPQPKDVFTRHRGEVDSNQQREEAGDVSQHVAVCVGQGVVLFFHRRHVFFGDQVSLLIVGPEQVLWVGEKEEERSDFTWSCLQADGGVTMAAGY